MFSERALELYELISSKTVPISQNKKETVKQHLFFTKENQTKCQEAPAFPPLSASAAIESLAELLSN